MARRLCVLRHAQLFAAPCGLSGSSVHGILQQEYWGGLPFSPPGDLPDAGMEPKSISSFQNHILMAGGTRSEEAEEGRTPDSVEGFRACGLLTRARGPQDLSLGWGNRHPVWEQTPSHGTPLLGSPPRYTQMNPWQGCRHVWRSRGALVEERRPPGVPRAAAGSKANSSSRTGPPDPSGSGPGQAQERRSCPPFLGILRKWPGHPSPRWSSGCGPRVTGAKQWPGRAGVTGSRLRAPD